MNSVFDVAKYFLILQDTDAGDSITNLKLQKLVYYAQGFHLALYDKPLFKEKIMKWEHGPVVAELYTRYSSFGSKALPIPKKFSFEVIAEETREFLDEIYRVLGQFSAWKLRNMTHDELPWKSAKRNQEISHPTLKKYFKTLSKK